VRLSQAILSLEEMPARCAVISEAKELGFPAGHLLYGKEKGTYRIIFDIREVEQHVGVLAYLACFPQCDHCRRHCRGSVILRSAASLLT